MNPFVESFSSNFHKEQPGNKRKLTLKIPFD